MRFAAASFLALAVIAAQFAHSGLMEPFLPYPAYALVCLGVLCALPSAFAGKRQPWGWLTVAVVALAGYSVWRCAVAADAGLAVRDETLILACAGMWAGVSLGVTRNDARFVFVLLLLAAGCAQVAVGVIQLLHPADFSQPYWLSQQLRDSYEFRFPFRARGLFVNPNQFAWLMNVLALLALSVGIWGRMGVVRRIGLLYLAAVFAVMTVLSASRGGIVSLVAGFAVFLALSLVAMALSVTQRRGLLLVVGSALLVMCACAAWVAFSSSWVAQSRLDSLLNPDVRSGFVEQAVRLFQTQPLLGVGPGAYKYAARLYRTGDVPTDPVYAHDDWLQYPAEYGFAGFAILAVAFVLVAAAGVRGFLALVRVASTETGSALSSSGAFVLGALCALAAAAVHGNVDFNMHVPANALLAAALLGLVTGARPLGIDGANARLRPAAWLTAAAALAAACGLAAILVKRGEAEYHALLAEDALMQSDIGRTVAEADKGLALLPDDALLLSLRARAYFEYEPWLMMKAPEPPENEDENADFDEQPPVELTAEESAGNYRNAVQLYERLVRLEPQERRHYAMLAQSLDALGRHEEARRAFVEAIRLDPWQALTWANYGDYFVGLEKPEAARRIFEIGAQLPGGEYARSQVGAIDDDAAFEKEQAQEEQQEDAGGDDGTSTEGESQ